MLFQYLRPKTVRGQVNVFAFPENPAICPVQSLKDYLTKSALLQNADIYSLFLAHTKPYKSIASLTLATQMKWVMAEVGIDTSKFKQYSSLNALAAWLRKPRLSQWPKSESKPMVLSNRYLLEIVSRSGPPKWTLIVGILLL